MLPKPRMKARRFIASFMCSMMRLARRFARLSRSKDGHWPFILVCSTSPTHFAVSAWMKRAKSSGELRAAGSYPDAASRWRSSPSSRPRCTAELSFPITAGGVPLGATSPFHPSTEKPASPASAIAGRPGTSGEADSEVTAMPRTLPPSICEAAVDAIENIISTAPLTTALSAELASRNGTCNDVDAGHGLEQLTREMRRRADAGGGIVELAGLGLGQRHQLGEVLRLNRRMNHQHERHGREQRDRRKVAAEVERALRQRGVDGVGGAREQQRVAVGRRARDRLRRDRSARARARLDHDLLAQHLSDLGPEQPRRDVGAGPDDHANEAAGIVLRRRSADGTQRERDERECKATTPRRRHPRHVARLTLACRDVRRSRHDRGARRRWSRRA